MEIRYNINLRHDEFVMLLEILKRAQNKGITSWDAAGSIIEKTKIVEPEQ